MSLEHLLTASLACVQASCRAGRHARLQVSAQAVAAPEKAIERVDVPLKLEEGDLPLNTFSPKKPFKAKIKSVERIVGPKATGETCHIIIETDGKIPFWGGPVLRRHPPSAPLYQLAVRARGVAHRLGMQGRAVSSAAGLTAGHAVPAKQAARTPGSLTMQTSSSAREHAGARSQVGARR